MIRSPGTLSTLPRISEVGEGDESIDEKETLPPSVQTDGIGEDPFENMNIQVTVYAVSGILRRTIERKSSARKFGCYKNNKLKASSDMHSKSPTVIYSASGFRSLASSKGTLGTKRETNTNDCQSTAFDPENVPVPTTAVVSVHREIRSSGFAIETFLPSMRIKSKKSDDGKSRRCSAFWADDSCLALLDNDYRTEPSKFEITRTMQRESYRPDTTIGQVSSFVHERIDMNVSIGRGKELIPLGIASIAITGDEEGEFITNVPIKSATPKEIGMSYSLKNQKKKSYKPCFSDDPLDLYSLEENATLRVGVRVLPAKMREESERYALKQFRTTNADSTTGEDHFYIELNDENSLIENLIMKDSYSYSMSLDEDIFSEASVVAIPPKTPDYIGGGFFCGAADIRMCAALSNGGSNIGMKLMNRSTGSSSNDISNENSNENENKHSAVKTLKKAMKFRNKNTAARILSLSNMSEMSDSTTDSDYDSIFDGVLPPQRAQL